MTKEGLIIIFPNEKNQHCDNENVRIFFLKVVTDTIFGIQYELRYNK